MPESGTGAVQNPFAGGKTPEWTHDQWNAFVAAPGFIERYAEPRQGTVDTGGLVRDFGMQGYLAILDHCPHLVVYKGKVIHADSRPGQDLLEKVLRRGELPLMRLAEAGILAGDKADDMIQDAITLADQFLLPGIVWDDDAYAAAMQWAPDQWREAMRYSDFPHHYEHGGIVQMTKFKKDEMPAELVERMVNRATNLVRVGDIVVDADTDEGIVLLEKALAEGKVTLARLIEAEVFTKEEALRMHHEAVTFAAEHLIPGGKWTQEERDKVTPWIPEQWDALVDTPQFDAFVKDGFVDVQSLKSLMGADLFNVMVAKAPVLFELGSRIVDSATVEGLEQVRVASENGEVPLKILMEIGILTQADADKKLADAEKIANSCFAEGSRWDARSVKDAMRWSCDEWEAALASAHFSERYVHKGVVQREKLLEIMPLELYERMSERTAFLIPLRKELFDLRTAHGKEEAEKALWSGDIDVHTGLKIGLLTRDQAENLYDQAREIARRNFQPGVHWNEEDTEKAKVWSADQWGKALEVVNFSELFTKNGIVNRDRAVVAMGPELFESMVRRVKDFRSMGSTVYDGTTHEGHEKIIELGLLS